MDLDHDLDGYDVIDFLSEDDCEMCGGVLDPIGRLGRLVWHRCRHCGWDVHEPA